MPRKIGLEIECVGLSPHALAEALSNFGVNVRSVGYNHDTMDCWKTVSDGSLHGTAAELVSPPIVWDAEGKAEVFKVITALEAVGVSTDTRCGFHVHVDANDLKANEIRNIFRRYRAFESDIDSILHRRRRGNENNYCRSLRSYNFEEPIRDVSALSRAFSSAGVEHRYHKVNYASFVKYGTIEFRQHQGTVRYSDILNWVTFCVDFVEQSKVTADDRPIRSETPAEGGIYAWVNSAMSDSRANRANASRDTRQKLYHEMANAAAYSWYRMDMDAVGIDCVLAIREVMKYMGVDVKVYKSRGARTFYVKPADRATFIARFNALRAAHEMNFDGDGNRISGFARTAPSTPAASTVTGTMWDGISAATRAYYRVRQATLS